MGRWTVTRGETGARTDQELVCGDCRGTFVFTGGEQQFYEQKAFEPPRRCPACREVKRAQRAAAGLGR